MTTIKKKKKISQIQHFAHIIAVTSSTIIYMTFHIKTDKYIYVQNE